MTFVGRDEPCDLPELEAPEMGPEVPTEGGGGTTLVASGLPFRAAPEDTLGGGGTTS